MTKNDEITVNTEQVQDALVLQPNDEYRDKRTLVFNVGFSTIYRHQDETHDTPSDYKETVKALLDRWHPVREIVIRSSQTKVISEVFEDNFRYVLREENSYDMVHESEDTISLLHM